MSPLDAGPKRLYDLMFSESERLRDLPPDLRQLVRAYHPDARKNDRFCFWEEDDGSITVYKMVR